MTTILVLKYPSTPDDVLTSLTILCSKSKAGTPDTVSETASPTTKGDAIPSGKSKVVLTPVVIPTTLRVVTGPREILELSKVCT